MPRQSLTSFKNIFFNISAREISSKAAFAIDDSYVPNLIQLTKKLIKKNHWYAETENQLRIYIKKLAHAVENEESEEALSYLLELYNCAKQSGSFYIKAIHREFSVIADPLVNPMVTLTYASSFIADYEKLGINPNPLKTKKIIESFRKIQHPENIDCCLAIANLFYRTDIPENSSEDYSPLDKCFDRYLNFVEENLQREKITETEIVLGMQCFAEMGSIRAAKKLAELFRSGEGVVVADAASAKRFSELAETSHEKCLQECVKWLQEAAEISSKLELWEKLYEVAIEYIRVSSCADFYGKNISLNLAIDWLKRAELHTPATLKLADIYSYGKREIAANRFLALSYFRKAYMQFIQEESFEKARELCQNVYNFLLTEPKESEKLFRDNWKDSILVCEKLNYYTEQLQKKELLDENNFIAEETTVVEGKINCVQ